MATATDRPVWENTTAILDISPMIHATWHTSPPIPGTDLEFAPAVAAFERVVAFAKYQKPGCIIAIFDGGGKTWRHELNHEYKANRPPRPDGMTENFDHLLGLLQGAGIVCFRKRHWEADDLIATLAKREARNGHVVIVSRDKDFWQLIKRGTWSWDPFKKQLIGAAEVVAKFGVAPRNMLDFLSIMGDASDNIKGVKGIGEKGAAKLIQAHKTLESIYRNLPKLDSKVAVKLLASKDLAFASRELVRLRFDVEMQAV